MCIVYMVMAHIRCYFILLQLITITNGSVVAAALQYYNILYLTYCYTSRS